MSSQKLRVGIIGMGFYAASSHIPWLRATGRAEVVAAARRDAHRLELARQELGIPHTFTDWREMLDQVELDAVVVATPHNYHREPAVAAMERGLHVLLEKPLASTVADSCAILAAARQSDRVVAMGVNRRGDATWRAAQRALSAGEIGQLRQINAVVSFDMRIFREAIPFPQELLDRWGTSPMFKTFILDIPQPGNWRNDPVQVGGDTFADTGSHLVDIMVWLGGAPPVEVLAYSPKNHPRGAAILTLQALLSNDVILSITFNDHVAMGDAFNFAGGGELTVLGDRGQFKTTLGWDSGPAQNPVIERNGDRQPLQIEGETINPAAGFVSSILDGSPVLATVEDAARVVALIQSAYRSAETRQLVQVDPI
jgi:predicted dehydrogenase